MCGWQLVWCSITHVQMARSLKSPCVAVFQSYRVTRPCTFLRIPIACVCRPFPMQDLVGLTVVLQSSGELVGHVSDVFDGTGTHDVLRIQLAPSQLERLAASSSGSSGGGSSEEGGEDGGEEAEEGAEGGGAPGPRHVLLPFAKAMVPVVDLSARRMEITPPEGLLELAAPSNLRRPRRENRGKRERRKPRPRVQSQAAEPGAAAAGSSGGSDAAS